jgi:hypothetical protein
VIIGLNFLNLMLSHDPVAAFTEPDINYSIKVIFSFQVINKYKLINTILVVKKTTV